jgi:hypothetical protein
MLAAGVREPDEDREDQDADEPRHEENGAADQADPSGDRVPGEERHTGDDEKADRPDREQEPEEAVHAVASLDPRVPVTGGSRHEASIVSTPRASVIRSSRVAPPVGDPTPGSPGV